MSRLASWWGTSFIAVMVLKYDLILLQWLLLATIFRVCLWDGRCWDVRRWQCPLLVLQQNTATLTGLGKCLGGQCLATERFKSKCEKTLKHKRHICCTPCSFSSWWESWKLHFVQFLYKKEDCSTRLCNRFSQLTTGVAKIVSLHVAFHIQLVRLFNFGDSQGNSHCRRLHKVQYPSCSYVLSITNTYPREKKILPRKTQKDFTEDCKNGGTPLSQRQGLPMNPWLCPTHLWWHQQVVKCFKGRACSSISSNPKPKSSARVNLCESTAQETSRAIKYLGSRLKFLSSESWKRPRRISIHLSCWGRIAPHSVFTLALPCLILKAMRVPQGAFGGFFSACLVKAFETDEHGGVNGRETNQAP